MSEDNSKTIDVSVTYSNNMQFLNISNKELYDKIRLLESQFQENENVQKYDLKYNKTYFDVYHRQSKSFLYNQDSNAYSQNVVTQIKENKINNNFKPYMPLHFNETFMHHLPNSNIMDDNFSAAAPIVDYVNKNGIQGQNNPNVHKFIFFGVALGLHLQEIHKSFNCKVYLICEPDLELFRLSLFTTPYSQIAKNSDLIFSVAQSEIQFQEKCNLFLEKRYLLNYNITYNLFSLRAASLIKIFQSVVTAQSFITYAYPRRFMSCERPFQYSINKLNFLDVTTHKIRTSTLSNHPVLVLASGPSLSNNIQWVMKNQNKFIIVTVSANLRLLSQYKIKPDIIISIDADRDANLKSLEGVDLEYFNESMVVLSSITHPRIVEKFNKNTTFMMQSVATYYSDLSKLFAISVGEVVYAFSLIYGSKEVYLLGLNYALDPESNQSHSQSHIGNVEHKDIKDGHSHEELDLHKNYLRVKGNFRDEINTTTALYVSITECNYFTKGLKTQDTKVFNLSDGAYLENITPLEIKDLNCDEIVSLDKIQIKNSIKEELLKNSRFKLSSHDKKIINRKIKNAKHIKQLIKLQMAKTNYKDTKSFLVDIEMLINKISMGTNKTESIELNQILFEYTRLVSHYIYEMCEQAALGWESFRNMNDLFKTNLPHVTGESQDMDEFSDVKNMNKIFMTQLLKITDKYIDTIQTYMSKL